MRPTLYAVIDEQVPVDFILTKAQADILEHWKTGANLFSVGQIALRNDIKRGAARRQIKQLLRIGVIQIFGIRPGGSKT